MSDGGLAPGIEVSALIRRAEAAGDFGMVLRKGDPERGTLLVAVASRGRHVACLERILTVGGTYQWQRSGPAESASSTELADFLARRARSDADLWLIELDIASAEQFIAETTLTG